MALHEVSTPETEMHDVQLLKNDLGLGITVAGYVCDEENISGIFVKDICTGSSADLTGNIQIYDRIVKVNGKSVTALNNYQAIEILRRSGPKVIISLERYLRGPKYERLQQSICSTPLPSLAETAPSALMFLDNSERTSQEEELRLNVTTQNTEEIKVAGISLNDDTLYNNKYELRPDITEKRAIASPLNSSENSNIRNNTCEGQNLVIHVVGTATEPEELRSIGAAEKGNSFDHIKNMTGEEGEKIAQIIIKTDISINSDSSCIYLSKASDDTEKDGYETCIDESLSDEICTKSQTETIYDDIQTEIVRDYNESETRAHFQRILLNADLSAASSEPSLSGNNLTRLSTRDCLKWNSYTSADVKSYNNPSDFNETDEFFLIQRVDDNTNENDLREYLSESNVINSYGLPTSATYKCLKLQEYYNDYKDCMEEYNIVIKSQDETVSSTSKCNENEKYSNLHIENSSNDKKFVSQNLTIKSNSEPHISETVCNSEFFHSSERRFSFLSDYENAQNRNKTTMTVTSKQPTFKLEKESAVKANFEKHWGSIKNIQIHREANESLGITIVCGKVDLYTPDTALGTTSGIFVKNIVSDSAAGRTNQFHVGDRILEVDGIDLREAGHEEAIVAIRNAQNTVSFIVQSLLPLNVCKHADHLTEDTVLETQYQSETSHPSQEIEITENLVDGRPNLSNERERDKEKEDMWVDGEIQKNDEATEVNADAKEYAYQIDEGKEHEIDRSSAENLERSEEITDDLEEEDEFGYNIEKIRKKYARLGSTIMMVQLERGQQGLGLSLAGHKDRNCMAVFVCGLNPTGAAYRTGGIVVGDEILEVNGVVLHGRCHLNASAIIKGLAGPTFEIVILRRKTAIDDIAVRPVTQFPVSLEEDQFSEDQFAAYPNVRKVAISKGTHSLGIMIIEGKHAELGQGIFISDIQDESTAEKAGLEVGELILAVNGDSLIDADYNTAAGLLKRTEGLVTLILSNPSKKSVDTVTVPANTEGEVVTTLKAAAPASRATTPVPEPPADPSTCSIIPGRNNTIEMVTDNQALGLFFVGGKDTLLSAGIIVVEVYPEGAVHKDGRVQAGDQILDANGICLKEATNDIALQTLRQTLPKMKLIIFRPQNIEYATIEVDLTKKPGKGLGLSVAAKRSGKGVYISEILDGGNAEIDGRITKGDLLVSVNGQNMENLAVDEIGAALKTICGKTVLKLHRYRPVTR